MSLAGELLRERLERRARALAVDLRTALLRSYDLLRKRLTDQELERLASGEDLAQVVTDPDARRALDLVQRELRAGVEASGRAWAQDVPGVGRGIAFNVLNPDVVTAIQTLNTRVMTTFSETVRDAIRTQTEAGIRAGVNPRTTARHLREAVGLAPNQVRAIDNFRRMLEEGDREALTRALRDRRFDGILRRKFNQQTGLRAFHGTQVRFSRFDPSRIGTGTDAGFLGRGFYFSTDPAIGRTSPVTMEVRLEIKAPLKISLPTWGTGKQMVVRQALGLPESASAQEVTAALRAKGFDSVVLDYSSLGYKHQEIMVPDADRIQIGGGLSEAQIDRMTEAYRRRMQAFHAETIARTAALDAQRLGQHLTWQGAVERGDVDGDQLTKRWSGTLDDRERATHLAMEGETVAWDALYSNGQMMPGDTEYGCRCVSIYSTRSRPKAGAGAYGIAGEQLVRGAAR